MIDAKACRHVRIEMKAARHGRIPDGRGRDPSTRLHQKCDLTRELQVKIGRARDQLLVFLDHPGTDEVTNNGWERLRRPNVVHGKMTNGCRAMWAAAGEADIRTVVDTARIADVGPFATILATVT